MVIRCAVSPLPPSAQFWLVGVRVSARAGGSEGSPEGAVAGGREWPPRATRRGFMAGPAAV